MSVLVLGGSGLLGSEISIDGCLKPSSKELNALDYCALRRYVQTYRVTKIIHAAGLVGGIHANQTRLYDFFQQNLQMNMNVVEICKEFSLNGSIFILSTCVMPHIANLPYTEDSIHLGEPHSSNYGYAYAKRMLEVGSRSLKEQYGISTSCIVPCNLYGMRDNYNLESGHVIPSLIHKMYLAKKNKQDMVVWGTGMPIREFLYASDLARIIENMMVTHNPETMIVSQDESYSIRDIVQKIANIMEFDGKILYDISKPDGIYKKPSSNRVFRKNNPDFKFTGIEDGLKQTIDYFTNNYDKVRK
jgi:GDP-L-fucose synthase